MEVVLRMKHDSIHRITGVTPWQTNRWQNITYYWDEYHPTYGWTNLSNYQSDKRVPFRVSINSDGLRGLRDYARTPPPGKDRVLVFGDSFTFGEEVDDDQTVPFYLEQNLRNVEVLNFGVHGFGPGQMALRIEEEAFQFSPTHIIVIYPTHDYYRPGKSQLGHPKPAFHEVDGSLQISNVPVPATSQQPWLYRHSYTAAWIGGRRTIAPIRSSTFHADMRVLGLILRRIHSVCRKHDVPVTVAHLAEPQTIRGILEAGDPWTSETIEQVNDVIEQAEVPVIDLHEFLFQAYEKHGKSLVAPCGHWAAEGNRMIAEHLAGQLTRDYPHWAMASQPTPEMAEPTSKSTRDKPAN